MPTLRFAIVTLTLWLIADSAIFAATIRECEEFLQQGQYEECLTAANEALERRSYGEDWPLLKAEAQRQLGQYAEAAQTLDEGLLRYSWSIRLRIQVYHLCAVLGTIERRQELLEEINNLAAATPWRYTDADDLVALGQAALALGADPKDVLEGFFRRAMKNYSQRSSGFLAAGQLAIDKGDFALAAEILRPAVEQFPDDADVMFALALALTGSDPEETSKLISTTLSLNPRHTPALQRVAQQQIDAEEFAEAGQTIQQIHAVNPAHPEGHALMAVIHHLHSRHEEEQKSRAKALELSDRNPAIDYLIGERLSRKYRFKEAVEYLRRALQADPDYQPAKVQLARDLLRLGESQTGWKLAAEAQKRDEYSTALFNLMQLRDSLDDFETRRTDRFIIRMTKRESAVYGANVERLLNAAFDELTQRYDYVPPEPVVVEIFDRPDDFAVRTFGMPDVGGFLGVCFGNLITANSPASMRGTPNNWESVLWHEFCHVITLQMTGNKIPRWLSEGVSVYEERRQDARWGQSMDPAFHSRITSGRITPVSELSSAFLNAGSGGDLNFAYYESSMVVQFIVEEHGFVALTSILQDLSEGVMINDALQRHTRELESLNADFERYLKQLAADYAPGVTFPSSLQRSTNGNSEPATDEPEPVNPERETTDYNAELAIARRRVERGDFDEAETGLKRLIEIYPQDTSPGGARKLLAALYGRREKPVEQAAVLAQHLERSADDLDACMTLLALQIESEDWKAAVRTGRLAMAIDPLQTQLVRQVLTASLALNDQVTGLQCLAGLLELEPADAARTHLRMGQLLQRDAPGKARRHALLALERAPRYRDAHRLLLDLTDRKPDSETGDATTPPSDLLLTN